VGIKYRLVNVANQVLGRFGARLDRTDAPAGWQFRDLRSQYDNLVQEHYQCLREENFGHLPETPGRMPLLCELVGTNISEAMWLIDKLHTTFDVSGDVCEFGIAEGATSALLANEIRPTKKQLWLFDSFEGLPQPTAKDQLIDDIFNLGSMEAYAGRMSYAATEVEKRLNSIGFPQERTRVVPGFIEESIKEAVLPTAVCFSYVDFDFYEPIVIALDFLHSVLSPNGIVVVDDYGFFSSGAKSAVDEFVAKHSKEYRLEFPPTWAGHFAILERAKN
jgi:O-methyltransferase